MRDADDAGGHNYPGGNNSVNEERRRNRHRENVDHEGIDLERLRYFTQPPANPGTHTRHRRRRQPNDQLDGRQPTDQLPVAETPETFVRAKPVVIEPVNTRTPVNTRKSVPVHDEPAYARPAYEGSEYPESEYPESEYTESGYAESGYPDSRYEGSAYGGPAYDTVGLLGHDAEGHTDLDFDHDVDHDLDDISTGQGPAEPPRPRRRRGARKRRRVVLAVVLTCLLVAIAGVGYFGLRAAGLLDSRKDYTNQAGTADVLVEIPDNSTLRDFGQILVDHDVVASVRAFTNAADGQTISGGFYKMRTEIPAATAVAMLTDGTDHRVGRVVIPEGLPLDTKTAADGSVRKGTFERIASATGVTINSQRVGVTVEQLENAAADSTPEQLGVPAWARERVEKLTGDHHRIEGLIAPIAWERIDPSHSALQILREMITQSERQFTQWEFPERNASTLDPYDTLVAASMVQGEVNQPDDYAKVARVILNRLARGQLLQFDSTANYTAEIIDLNVHKDDLKADTPWNTYVHKGLPPTPIGAVGERALEAMEKPAVGDWLYFVTVDSNGTTLFTADFDQHRRNIAKACANKFITCN